MRPVANWPSEVSIPLRRSGVTSSATSAKPTSGRYSASVETLLRAGDAGGQALERRFDPPAELVVHRPFFAAPIGRTAQDHSLVGLGVARQLDLDALVHGAPAVCTGEFSAELLQLRLRCADDVAPAGVEQPRQIGDAGHAAVGDPDAPQQAMA